MLFGTALRTFYETVLLCDKKGDSCLHLACLHVLDNVVEQLQAAGANPGWLLFGAWIYFSDFQALSVIFQRGFEAAKEKQEAAEATERQRERRLPRHCDRSPPTSRRTQHRRHREASSTKISGLPNVECLSCSRPRR